VVVLQNKGKSRGENSTKRGGSEAAAGSEATRRKEKMKGETAISEKQWFATAGEGV